MVFIELKFTEQALKRMTKYIDKISNLNTLSPSIENSVTVSHLCNLFDFFHPIYSLPSSKICIPFKVESFETSLCDLTPWFGGV